ncbi:hypothetical protein Trydic_g12918 [Trypoxylus dichotomus]
MLQPGGAYFKYMSQIETEDPALSATLWATRNGIAHKGGEKTYVLAEIHYVHSLYLFRQKKEELHKSSLHCLNRVWVCVINRKPVDQRSVLQPGSNERKE